MVLNPNILTNIRVLEEQTGTKLLVRLAEIYLCTAPAMVGDMIKFDRDRLYAEIAMRARSLECSSLNLGAEELAQCCQKIEQLILREDDSLRSEISNQIQKSNACLDRVIHELNKICFSA